MLRMIILALLFSCALIIWIELLSLTLLAHLDEIVQFAESTLLQ